MAAWTPRLLPVHRALAAHAVCAPLAIMAARRLGDPGAWPWLEGMLAAMTGALLGLAPWWAVINLAFAPALQAAQGWTLSPLWWLAAFLGFGLVYWSTFRTQVPLYLSNAATLRELARLLPARSGFRFADLGCGVGSVLQALAGARPDGRYEGFETAPLPWCIAWWRARGARACTVFRRDFWSRSLAQYDIVYAFLSPVPMPRLWDKARREMRCGTLFVSNRFIVPGVAPHRTIATGEPGVTLYVYRMGS